MQRAIGDYRARAGGARYSSPIVAEVLAWLASEGVGAIGQSRGDRRDSRSVPERDAVPLLRSSAAGRGDGLRFALSRGRNHGGEIVAEESVPGFALPFCS